MIVWDRVYEYTGRLGQVWVESVEMAEKGGGVLIIYFASFAGVGFLDMSCLFSSVAFPLAFGHFVASSVFLLRA